MANTRRLSVCLAATLALSGVALAQNDKRIFLGPSVRGGIAEYEALFEPGADWAWVHRQGTLFQFHAQNLRESTPLSLSDATLEKATAFLAAAGLDVGVEAGGLRMFPGSDDPANWHLAGETQAKVESKGYERLVRFGGEMDMLLLDAPFSYALLQMGMPWDVAAQELSDYLDVVKKHHPDVEVGLIEPVPHYELAGFPVANQKQFGNLRHLFDTVLPILSARGHEISLFMADSPYSVTETSLGGWEKLAAAGYLAQARDMRFGWYVNDNVGGKTSEKVFLENSLLGLERLREAGGDPDDFSVRSWYDFPKLTLPDSDPATFMGIARRLMEHVYANYEAPNRDSLTLVFEDGKLEPLRVKHGAAEVQDGALELAEASEVRLFGKEYTEPSIYLFGDMLGMQPGSEARVVLWRQNESLHHEVVLVTNDRQSCHVELRLVDPVFGASHLLAKGAQVLADPLQYMGHFAVRVQDGLLLASVDSQISLAVPFQVAAPVHVGVGSAAPGVPYTGRMHLELLDLREGDAPPNVEFDSNGHIVFSLLQEDLLPMFDTENWLNAFDGMILPFSDFEMAVLPNFEFEAVREDHVVMRSEFPVKPGSIITLVYGGDFETIVVK